MQVFIKDGKTFETISHNEVLGYELKKSIYDVVSTIHIIAPETLPKTGDIIYVDEVDFFGVLKEVELDNKIAILKVNQIVTLLNRDLVYKSATYTYLEDYLKTLIDTNYTNCADDVYAMPWLTVNAATHTQRTISPDTEKNVFNIKSYLSKVRRLQNIFCKWEISRTELTLNLVNSLKAKRNVDFSNPAFKIVDESYSEKTVSKITSICEENNQTQDWYLLKNGNVTSTVPPAETRVTGEWTVLTVAKAADVADDVKDEFKKNTYSHSIEFSAQKESGFVLYDRVTVSINNELFESYVTTVGVASGANRITISLGELQTVYPYLDLI